MDLQELNMRKPDKYDYLIATACGMIGALVDVFLVASPGESVLGAWSDSQVNKAVEGFAKLNGWNKNDGIKGAIDFLEEKFPINYDQAIGKAGSEIFGITPSNHHMKSLGHSPDIIGLFFSIINQFTSTSSFIIDGRLITMNTDTFELQGGNFVAKIFCGFFNWICHLISLSRVPELSIRRFLVLIKS